MNACERLQNIDKKVAAVLEKGLPEDLDEAHDAKYNVRTKLVLVKSSVAYIIKKLKEEAPEVLEMDASNAPHIDQKKYAALWGNKNLVNSSKNVAYAERILLGKIQYNPRKASDKEQQPTRLQPQETQPQPVKQPDKVEKKTKDCEQKSIFDRVKHGVSVFMSGEDYEAQAKTKKDKKIAKTTSSESTKKTLDNGYVEVLEKKLDELERKNNLLVNENIYLKKKLEEYDNTGEHLEIEVIPDDFWKDLED